MKFFMNTSHEFVSISLHLRIIDFFWALFRIMSWIPRSKKTHCRAQKDFYPSVNLDCAFLNPTRSLLQRKSSEAEFDKWHIVFL